MALLLPQLPGNAQSSRPLLPPDIEAAYLYNFGKFVDWPAPDPDNAAVPFSICILGKDDFGPTLESLVQNDTVKGRTVAVKRLPSLAGTDNCQILFLAPSEKPRLVQDLDALKDKPVLTVSTLPDFLDRGGMVQFMVQDNRVRFAVNLAPAARVRLSLSSELLKVAVYVNSMQSQGGQ